MKANYLIQAFHEYIRKKCFDEMSICSAEKLSKKRFSVSKILKKNLFIFAKNASRIRTIKISKNENEMNLIRSKIASTQLRIRTKSFRIKKNKKSKRQTKVNERNLL